MKCLSLKSQPSKAKPTIIIVKSDKTIFYLVAVSVKKCGGSFNTVDDPYAWGCASNKVKDMNVKVFHLMLGVNKTRFIVQHKSCEYKSGFEESERNSKQKWKRDECRRELDWSSCEKDYTWNLTTSICKGSKAWKIGEYLDIKNGSCEKRLIDKLVLECEDERLNTTETSLKKEKTMQKNIVLFTRFH